MDGGGVNHYVGGAALAGERPIWIRLLELLLFLSAMLAGLTGLISGERAVETRQVEASAVAAAAEAGLRTAETASQAVADRAPAPRVRSAASVPQPAATADPLPQAAPVDERRLE
jgi:hypothetical protein